MCTAATYRSQDFYFGRTFDYEFNYGEEVTVTPRNYPFPLFHRNFDLGVSQAEHPEIFAAYPSESEGKRMVKDVTVYLRSNHMSAGLPHFYMQCACKYAGYLLGKNYRRLPKKWVLAFTSNKEYWKQNRKDV